MRKIFLILILTTLITVIACSKEEPQIKTGVLSSALKQTQIVPTLHMPIEKGKNIIWCASFLSSWKVLQEKYGNGGVEVEGAEEYSKVLNGANDPRKNIPEKCLYANAGFVNEGVLETILKDMKKMFPLKEAPSFPGILPDSVVAYSYLEANVKFTIPFFQNDESLEFIDSNGNTRQVSSFGVRPKDEYAYYKLREKVRILFTDYKTDSIEPNDFAIDLCGDSKPSQIVVAVTEPEPTLAATLEKVNNRININSNRRLGANDSLLVPDIYFNIVHHFRELEKKSFKNSSLKTKSLDVAQQDIVFKLDRSGAELKSESKLYATPVPTHYVLNRPFLIYMQKRGTNQPYFVMWVDNAEHLKKFK